MLAPPTDPAAERAVAERLLPGAREVLIAPGARGESESLDLVERLTPAARTEVICPPNAGADLIDRLLSRGCTVYDGSAVPATSILILDRRVGWRLPDWELLPAAFQTACRLSWTRLGYYTVLTGRVEETHSENALFRLAGRPIWVNTAYRGLPLPVPGDRLRILGLYSFLGSTVPIFHALRLDPAADAAEC